MLGKTLSFCIGGLLSWYWSMFSEIFVQNTRITVCCRSDNTQIYNTWMVHLLKLLFTVFTFVFT